MARPSRARPGRRAIGALLLALAALLLPVLALELGVRALIATGRLAEAPSHDPIMEAGLVRLLGSAPRDILLVGESQIQTAVDPAVLADRIEAATGDRPRIYDFGQPGAPPAANLVLLRRLARDGKLPKLVIADVSVATFRPGGEADRGEAIALEDSAAGRAFLASPLGELLAGCAPGLDIVERVDCELNRVSAAWRWHGRPGSLVRAIAGLPPNARANGGTFRADGFMALPGMDPDRLEAQLAEALRDSGKDRLAARPGRFGTFADLVGFLRANGVEVILVGMPLTHEFADALRAVTPTWDEDRRVASEALEAATGEDLVYVTDFGDWYGPGSAGNINHLSADGAIGFTDQLWGMPEFRDRVIDALAPTEGAGG